MSNSARLAVAGILSIVVTTSAIWGIEVGKSDDDAIQVINPVELSVDWLPAERIPVGEVGDYKPCIAKLSNGELLLTMFYPHYLAGVWWRGPTEPIQRAYREDIILYRSLDGGRIWSERRIPGLFGREPYLTVLRDGTIFITAHFLTADWRNTENCVYSYLHRSTDNGRNWSSISITGEDLPGYGPKSGIRVNTSRNVLELADGTLLLGISAPHGVDYLWRSYDHGQTWDKSLACQFIGAPKDYWWRMFEEAVLWEAAEGKLLSIHRVDPKAFPPLPGTEAPTEETDQAERMIVSESLDGGRTWRFTQDLGWYGEMYPALLQLADERLLLTFSVLAHRCQYTFNVGAPLHPPLGLRAVLGHEDEAGLHFDFEHDRLVLSAKTPVGLMSGGAFGNTVQLDDGTLVSVYSYRGEDYETRAEVLRWRLP